MNLLKNFFSGINLLMLLFIPALFVGCDDDNPGPGNGGGESNIRIVSADPSTDTYTFKNFGDAAEDISEWRLCSEFNYSADLSSLTLVNGSLNLAPDAEVMISGFPTDDEADFGLYLEEGGFDDPEAMVDFVQWGSGGNGRESVANTKGIWTAGDFIDGIAPFEFTGTGTQTGVSFWNATGVAGGPNIRFLSVNPGSDTYVIKNFGDQALDISSYRLCSLFDYTANLSGLTVLAGSLNLGPGEEVTLTGWAINDTAADLGLYIDGSFGSSNSMVDFVQWGSAGNGREGVANSKGIWTSGDFLSGAGPFDYTGDGTQNGLSFWQ